jgi:AcrR family transcriptional regulator
VPAPELTVEDTAGATPAMRADARRNRDKLLAAAGDQFAAQGADVALESIARAAGVGIGTLYRHFPSREALIEAAYLGEVDRLCAAADELLAAERPDEALARWMDRFVTYATRKRGLACALASISAADPELVPSARERLRSTVARLLAAGQREGVIRADVDGEDVIRAMSAAWNLPEGRQWASDARRLLGLLIDGLRYGA